MDNDTYIFIVVVAGFFAIIFLIWLVHERHLRSWRRDIRNGYCVEFYHPDKDFMLHGEVVGTAVDYVVVKTDYGMFQCKREDLFPWRS